MYLISNEFTLPAFLGHAAPHRRGFYLVKKGFARVEHRRNSGRTESSLEFNSRTRVQSPPPPPSPLVSHYPQQLLVFIFRIRSLLYVHVYHRVEERGYRGNEPPSLTIFAYAQATPAICSGRRAAGKRRYSVGCYVKIRPRSSSKTRCRRWWCSRSVIQSADGISVVVCPTASSRAAKTKEY